MKKMIRIFIAGLAIVFLTLNVAAQQSPAAQKDTLCIASSGHNNQVIINSKNATLLTGCSDSLNVKGEIVQRGENNSVKINTKREAPNNKRQITNKHQKTNNKNLKTKHKNTVIIKQSGKNNTVKINSR